MLKIALGPPHAEGGSVAPCLHSAKNRRTVSPLKRLINFNPKFLKFKYISLKTIIVNIV